jgi:hypothetical protein
MLQGLLVAVKILSAALAPVMIRLGLPAEQDQRWRDRLQYITLHPEDKEATKRSR